MGLKVYGIPTCGTVRKARAWLDARGIDYVYVDLRSSPPSRAQIQAWIEAVGEKALRNTSGGAYRALPERKANWSAEAWLDAFAADPMLIKRPVIERDGRVVLVGFRGTDAELIERLGH